jgi:peptidoglycan/xylan/chitin deacetylase (PgdA/CDA1 family)
MLRSIGKTFYAYAYTWSGMHRFFPGQTHPQTPFIVCYHRVVENFQRSATGAIPSMLISTGMLERQIDWLAKHFSLMSLDDIGSHLERATPFKRRAAAITFDDGYSDVYHHAYPLLKRKGIPAAFFVVTGLIDTGSPQIFDRLYLILHLLHAQGLPLRITVGRALRSIGVERAELQHIDQVEEPFALMTAVLKAFPRQQVETLISMLESHVPFRKDLLAEMAPLSWEMIQAMHRGGMTVGSHTKSHLLLTSESVEMAHTELVESKQTLETRLNAAINHFAYPDGRFNPALVDAVARAGYRFAYGICHSLDRTRPLLTIPRKVLWERSCLNAFGTFSSAVMNCQASWAFDSKKRCDHDHSMTGEKEKSGAFAAA